MEILSTLVFVKNVIKAIEILVNFKVAPTTAMVRTGKWGNTLVHNLLMTTSERLNQDAKTKQDKVEALRGRLWDHRARHGGRYGTKKHVEPVVKLRPRGVDDRSERQRENDMAIGGMRDPLSAIAKVPGHRITGPKAAACIEKFLDDHPGLDRGCLRGRQACGARRH